MQHQARIGLLRHLIIWFGIQADTNPLAPDALPRALCCWFARLCCHICRGVLAAPPSRSIVLRDTTTTAARLFWRILCHIPLLCQLRGAA
jgi:hypothetical protein